jgi:hypothetical protein
MLAKPKVVVGVASLGWILACATALGQFGPRGIPLPDIPSEPLPPPTPKKPKPKKLKFSTDLPAAASLPPRFLIPVAPMGFAPPSSSYYLGRRISLVSLDFLDENRLLFTFHASGLRRRDAEDSNPNAARQIHAVVIGLPDGKVEAQATWTVPDRSRYLWMLKDGQFLLRSSDGLQQGDEKLEMKSVENVPPNLTSLSLNPGQQVIVTTSAESSAQSAKPGPSVTPASLSPDPEEETDPGDYVVRAVQRSSGQVLLSHRSHAPFHAPVNAIGYVETSSAVKYHWTITLKFFHGEIRVISNLSSGCTPNLAFITDEELLQTICTPIGGLNLAAVSSNSGRTVWSFDAPPEAIWPLLVMSTDGSRIAREGLVLKDGVDLKKHPKFVKAIKGQVVRVLDAGNGKVVMEAPLSPMLDGGGNVAFSPSGRRLAVLSNGAVQVFDLPIAAPTPDLANEH